MTDLSVVQVLASFLLYLNDRTPMSRTVLANRTNDDFTEVTTSIGKAGELMGEISVGSQEQAQGIEQINRAVSEMDRRAFNLAEGS